MTKDGRVERGDQTRRTILRRAAEIASVEGLEGLSIGRLATELGVSKSGVFAHFGSKEELQLHTVRAAAAIFAQEVLRPEPDSLWQLCERWIAYSERRVFPGGCFFYAVQAEFDARPGRVRDAVAQYGLDWKALLERMVTEAGMPDPAQLTFEIVALLEGANAASVLHDDPQAYERARVALRARIAMPTGTLISIATPMESSTASNGSETS